MLYKETLHVWSAADIHVLCREPIKNSTEDVHLHLL